MGSCSYNYFLRTYTESDVCDKLNHLCVSAAGWFLSPCSIHPSLDALAAQLLFWQRKQFLLHCMESISFSPRIRWGIGLHFCYRIAELINKRRFLSFLCWDIRPPGNEQKYFATVGPPRGFVYFNGERRAAAGGNMCFAVHCILFCCTCKVCDAGLINWNRNSMTIDYLPEWALIWFYLSIGLFWLSFTFVFYCFIWFTCWFSSELVCFPSDKFLLLYLLN